MKAIHLLVWISFASTSNSQPLVNKHSPVFDVTMPLGAILENTTLIKNYIENLAEQSIHWKEKLSLLYALDCATFKDCAKRFPEVENILTTIENKTNLDFIFSITLNLSTLEKDITDEKIDNMTFNFILNAGAKMLVNIRKSTTCKEMYQNSSPLTLLVKTIKPLVPGIGYDESLFDCEYVTEADTIYPFVVVYLSFGETIGVTESYSLFWRRLTLIHKHQTEFFNTVKLRKMPETFYYPYIQSVGDVCHERLLARYIMPVESKSEAQNCCRLIVKVPSAKSPVSPMLNGFSTIANSIWEGHLSKPGVLETVTRHFTSMVIKYSDWKVVLKKGRKRDLLKEKLNSGSNINLHIVLDFSNHDDLYYKRVKKQLMRLKENNPFPNLHVDTLWFQWYNEFENGSMVRFAKRMSSHFTVGCVQYIKTEMFGKLDSSVAEKVASACNKINASFYVFQLVIDVYKKDVAAQTYSFFYENEIRKKLQEIKEYSNLLLQRIPAARLLIDASISTRYSDDEDTVTNFCQDRILYINEFYEAVINWASCNNIETVLKFTVDEATSPDELSWLSYLRPVSGNSYRLHKLAELHPYFVLRNYPKNMNNWTIDPCIQWETARPDIKAKYFHNSHVGTILYSDLIRPNTTLTANEYKILLQLVLNRFNLAEVVLQTDIENFVVACNWLATKKAINSKYKILLNYQISKTGNLNKVVNSEEALVLVFDQLKKNDLAAIQGIHFDFSRSDSKCIKNPSHPILNAKDLLAKSQIRNLKFGMLVDYKCCMNYIQLLVFRNASSHPISALLKQLQYLVCQERHKMKNIDHVTTIGKVLDSQLYLKKAFQEFSPSLELYFRVILIDLPNVGSSYSDAYMKTVSYFMQSGAAYNINYVIIDAFGGETTNSRWWAIKNLTDLSDPLTFIEREAESSNQFTWRPAAIVKESYTDEANSNVFGVSAAVAGGVVLMILASFGAYFYLRYRKLSQFLSKEEVQEFLNGRCNNSVSDFIEQPGDAESMKFNAEYNLHISDLHIDLQTILGKGNFGTVFKGSIKDTPAAIKAPNKNCSKMCFKSVLSEVKVLCYIGKHSNIVGFLGAYTNEIDRGVLYIATEFCANGSLETYLRKMNNVVASQDEHVLLTTAERGRALFVEDLCRFAIEIASGMEHLERKHVIHGDLSIRNVLLDQDFSCKIADFGLSRKLYEYQKYVKSSQEPLPWKWMSYETLTKMEFTSKSDVWSYGVAIWEIFSLGKVPYSILNWTLDFPEELKHGLRLSKPEFASQEIYMKLLDCWNLDPAQRPTFTELTSFFKELNKTEYVVLDEP